MTRKELCKLLNLRGDGRVAIHDTYYAVECLEDMAPAVIEKVQQFGTVDCSIVKGVAHIIVRFE